MYPPGVLFHNGGPFRGPNLIFVPASKCSTTLKIVKNHKKRRQHRFKTNILASRTMTFGFEIWDPRVMPGGIPWDPM